MRRKLTSTAVLALAGILAHPGSARAESSGAAAISGSFADSCRGFTAHARKSGSSTPKDISHVALTYADGRVVKDETVNSPDYSVQSGPGEEIAYAVVKSGTTTETFSCQRTGGPPTAVLEVFTPPVDLSDDPPPGSCSPVTAADNAYLGCSYHDGRTVWTHWGPGGQILWAICPGLAHEYCAAYPFDAIPWTFGFRGTTSADPDGDLSFWAIDFGDGTTASGSWATEPPANLEHTYLTRDFETNHGYLTITLTVTDAAGHTGADTLTIGLVAANDV